MRVVCLCGFVLHTANDGTNREMAGMCEHCVKTNDTTKSPHYKEEKKCQAPPPQKKRW